MSKPQPQSSKPADTAKPEADPARTEKDYAAALRADLSMLLDVAAPGRGAAMADQMMENLEGYLRQQGCLQAATPKPAETA